MLLGKVYLEEDHVMLEDMDGSKFSLTINDALTLGDWLHQMRDTLERKLSAFDESRQEKIEELLEKVDVLSETEPEQNPELS